MKKHCLIIADDLTGSADTGAQFAKFGFVTHIISLESFQDYNLASSEDEEVLVINTDSRTLDPGRAYDLLSELCKRVDFQSFPVIYKKIDSTLKGNIGSEIDAVLEEWTKCSLCFLSPSYPEQKRKLENGIMSLGEMSPALTEIDIVKLMQQQSQRPTRLIHLVELASGLISLEKNVTDHTVPESRVLIFDAVSRQDLKIIAKLAFRMDTIPLLVGSAGLAREIGEELFRASSKDKVPRYSAMNDSFTHVFIISGSASGVTHTQLDKLKAFIPTFEINKSYFQNDRMQNKELTEDLACQLGKQLSTGYAILRSCAEKIEFDEDMDKQQSPIILALSQVAFSALNMCNAHIGELLLILVGGETAQSTLDRLGYDRIEIIGELFDSIIASRIIGGKWDNLTIITKAGGFGNRDSLNNLVELVEKRKLRVLSAHG